MPSNTPKFPLISHAEFIDRIKYRLKIAPSKQRSHISTVIRRLDYLANRVAHEQKEYPNGSHNRREMAALAWMLEEVTQNERMR